MVKAEGGEHAFLVAVRISLPKTKDYKEARLVAANTIAHHLWDWMMQSHGPEMGDHLPAFVVYLGSFWAPVGAANDPNDLNKNWVPNVLAHLALD
jgi:hypothetical protein